MKKPEGINLSAWAALMAVTRAILDYESDTFSAEGSEITSVEAWGVAAKLIEYRIAIGDNVDGVTLSSVLEEVRNDTRQPNRRTVPKVS